MSTVPYLFDAKSPSERRSFGFNFSAAQEFQRSGSTPAQTIASSSVTCTDPALTIEAPVLSGRSDNPLILSSYINGGVAGVTYDVVYRVTTNVGAIIQRTVLLPVNDI